MHICIFSLKLLDSRFVHSFVKFSVKLLKKTWLPFLLKMKLQHLSTETAAKIVRKDLNVEDIHTCLIFLSVYGTIQVLGNFIRDIK